VGKGAALALTGGHSRVRAVPTRATASIDAWARRARTRLRPPYGSLIAAFLFLACVGDARAQPYADALAHFTADSFSETEQGINEVAASGNSLAATLITALQEGRLLFSAQEKLVLIRESAGGFLDLRTGQPFAGTPAADLAPVRLNNRLRRIIEGVLGTLTLLSPDPVKRLEAALAVFRSRDANALPALEQAITKETEPGIKRALMEARAAVVLYLEGASDADKIAAISVISKRGDQEALALLGGLPSTTSAPVMKAAADAIASIQSQLAIWTTLQNAWYGLSLGSVLLLAAIGLAITFGVMGVINMAHGEMVMLGAYTTYVVQQVIRAYSPAWLDYSLAIAIPLAFVVAGLIGILIERGIIRFLYGRPLETLLATWGLSLILQQAVRTLFGPTNKDVSAPSWMSGSFELGQLTITYNRLCIIVFTLLIFAGLLALLRWSRFGLEMRAVTQNRAMAASMGIRTSRIDALTFGLGSGIAGLAGVALSYIDNVSPNLGQGYIIDSFMVVVFGGVGNLWGTLVGAFTLGIANKFLEPYAGAVLGKIAILVLIILFIQKRPRGLFALKGRAAEA
jgi:urea transport system permease protein